MLVLAVLWLALIPDRIPEVSSGDESLATEPSYFGLAVVLGLGLLTWWILRRLARRGSPQGWAGQASERMGRGLGQALVALGSILQPHTPGPEDLPGAYTERDDDHNNRKPDPERAPKLFEDGEFPPDGLRTVLPPAADGAVGRGPPASNGL